LRSDDGEKDKQARRRSRNEVRADARSANPTVLPAASSTPNDTDASAFIDTTTRAM
jgi:hypothetical protein